MRRRLLNLLTALSLLLCVVFLLLWAISIFRCVEIRAGAGRPYGIFEVVVAVAPGQLRVGTVRERLAPDDPDPRRGRRWLWRSTFYRPEATPSPRTMLERLGFERVTFADQNVTFARNGRTGGFEFASVSFPLWLAAGATAALPLIRLRERRRLARRAYLGQCRRCGYDLRATLGRCPECGAAPGVATVQQ